MMEALRRCGLRSISAVVDITNYVLLGQDSRVRLTSTASPEIVVRQPKRRRCSPDGAEVRSMMACW
jgi:phenylalanyl-tRNA synthetase beta subunit